MDVFSEDTVGPEFSSFDIGDNSSSSKVENMAAPLRSDHSISDIEDSAPKAPKNSGLLPRKSKKSTKTSTASSTNNHAAIVPITDNESQNNQQTPSSVPTDQSLTQQQIIEMNDKLNALMALMTDQPAQENIDEDSGPEDGEIEDSLDYFSSIADKESIQGATINEKLAVGVTAILRTGLNSEAKDEFKKLYICPENCKRMEVVTVNPEILNSASGQTKKQDHTSRLLQAELMKGLTASCTAYNLLYGFTLQETVSTRDIRRALRPLSDSISLQAHASHEIDVERRTSFKRDIKEEFASLCTGSYPVDNLLFGPELQEKIKTADDTAKLKLKVATTRRPQGTRKPYQGKGYKGSSSSFFAQGSSRRGGGNQYYPTHRNQGYKRTSPRKEQTAPQRQHKGRSNNNSNKKFTRQ